jgi:transposase
MLGGVKVPMPTKRVRKKKICGAIYIYRIVRSFRGINGKPKNEEKAIGKLDTETGMLIPNNSYYLFYPADCSRAMAQENSREAVEQLSSVLETSTDDLLSEAIADVQCTIEPQEITTLSENSSQKIITIYDKEKILHSNKSYGHIYVLQKISDGLGLSDVLAECFPTIHKEILMIAMYMVTDGNIMSGITDWYEQTELNLFDKFTDQMCSCLFAYLDFNSIMNFFIKWIKIHNDNEYMFYDVTSISSYSRNITYVEMGYNRDNETLPQLNFGMFYSKNFDIPIYYHDYQGSINDVTDLKFIMEKGLELGIKKVEFILDRGFISQSNFEFMHKNHINFMIPLPSGRKDISAIIDKNINNVKEYENWIDKYQIYGYKYEYKMYKIPIYAHIIFDTGRYDDDIKKFNENIKSYEAKLSSMSLYSKISKVYHNFFDITQKKDDNNKIIYFLNNNKIKQKVKYAGYLVYLTTNPNLSTQDVINIYKTRDLIEKSFLNLKDELFFSRLRTHSDRTTKGKLFVGFIALIIRTALAKKFDKFDKTKNLTFAEIIKKLKRITITKINNIIMKNIPFSKGQREIFEALGLLLDEFINDL